MKCTYECFNFSDDIESISDIDSFIARVPKKITTVDDLFTALFDILELPGYFGFNWNALSDCLRDFHWVSKYKIILIHEDLPSINESDLSFYLEVLQEAVNDWRGDESHEFVVFFPKNYQTSVITCLSLAIDRSG